MQENASGNKKTDHKAWPKYLNQTIERNIEVSCLDLQYQCDDLLSNNYARHNDLKWFIEDY